MRYWAASTGFGKDSMISEEKIQAGAKLATKLWNVAQLRRARSARTMRRRETPPAFSPADRWLLSRLQRLIGARHELFDEL